MSALLNSASICFGNVFHKRTLPKLNQFTYRVFYLRIPMRSRRIDSELLSRHGVADNSFAWLSFYDKDHGIGSLHSLEWVEDILKQANINAIDGEIWLHTFPRILGYVFNPVSFWFCHNAKGDLLAVVAEVNNTFGERHAYLLRESDLSPLKWSQQLCANKIFHVSPFFDLSGHYQFKFIRSLGNEITKHSSIIEYIRENHSGLLTSITGSEYPLTRKNVVKAIATYPLMSFGVMLRIHWQALKLLLKGVKFHSKPNPPDLTVS